MTIDNQASSIQFVFPFLFTAGDFDDIDTAIRDKSWLNGETPMRVWKEEKFSETDLLPHVARFLNPVDGAAPTARLWKVENAALQSYRGLGNQANWHLLTPDGRIAYSVQDIKLSLFCSGVGLLTIQAKPHGADRADVDAWLDFIHYFRYTQGRRKVAISGERSTGPGATEPFFPQVARASENLQPGQGTLHTIIEELLACKLANTERSQWWREVFVPGRLLPFCTLFVDGVPDSEQRVLHYRLRRWFHSRHKLHSCEEDLSPKHPALLAYAKNQWFDFSLEGGHFIAFDAPKDGFFRQQLPPHVREEYFLLFLIALNQRFSLMRLSEMVAEHWSAGRSDQHKAKWGRDVEKNFAAIRDGLLFFTARGYFTQVMQRDNHHRCYRRWQETFQVAELYKEVSEEVREMHDYLIMKRTQRLEQRLGLLGTLIGVPSLIIGFMGINIQGVTSPEGLPLPRVLSIVGVLSIILGGLLLWFLNSRRTVPDMDAVKSRALARLKGR